MPTITLDRKEFDRLMGKKISDSVLKDRISMLGTDLERLDKDEIVVEIFPNRPDLLSMQGFVRALKSFMGIKKGLIDFKVEKSGKKVIVDKSLPKEWPFAFACIVKGLKFNDEKIKEVIDIQEKLGVTLLRKRKKGGIGLYPLEKIKFPVRFEGRSPEKIKFKPLEFEREINGRQILSMHPTGREYAPIIAEWKKYPVFVDSNGVIMSMPPIINSDDVGKISESTTDVFLEATGTDFNVLKSAINMLVTALIDMGGKAYSVDVVYTGKKVVVPDLKPEEMKVDLDYCNKWLGLNLKEADLKKLLEKMGYGYKAKKVLIPAYRADIMHQVDIFEDVAIAYGYENFKEEIPKVATIGEESKMTVLKRKISDILAGLGLLELNTYNVSNKIMQNDRMGLKENLIELESSVSTDYTHLRGSMLPSLLEVFQNNKHHEYPQEIFDIGTVFKKGKSETGVDEIISLGVGLSGNFDYTNCKQILDYLLRMLGLEYEIDEGEHASFIKGRVGKVFVDKKEVGVIGEIHPAVLTNFKLEMPVVAFEINLSKIFDIF